MFSGHCRTDTGLLRCPLLLIDILDKFIGDLRYAQAHAQQTIDHILQVRRDNHFVFRQWDFLLVLNPLKAAMAKFLDISIQKADLPRYSQKSASSHATKAASVHLAATDLNDLIGWSENSPANRADASVHAFPAISTAASTKTLSTESGAGKPSECAGEKRSDNPPGPFPPSISNQFFVLSLLSEVLIFVQSPGF
jgi:hypothetical protein